MKELKQDGILLDKLHQGFFGIFQTVPNQETDNYSKSHLHKGIEYHNFFFQDGSRKIVWDLEQKLLRSLIEGQHFQRYLDFAGGTGRIAALVESHCDQSYILDISKEMLTVAADKLKKTRIICIDFNDEIPELDTVKFDLITAFRFFPNAEELLRISAMKFIADRLTDGGLLICNNHRNFWSISYFAHRLLFIGGRVGMSDQQMLDLSTLCGLRLVQTYSMGLIPQTEGKTLLLSWKLTEKIEKNLFTLIGKRHRRGYNVIYIFKKTN